MYINVFFCFLFLGGVNGRYDYLWPINFSSMEKSKTIFIFCFRYEMLVM